MLKYLAGAAALALFAASPAAAQSCAQNLKTSGVPLLTGLTYSTALYIGTEGTNFYKTLQDYDQRGRPNRSVSPTGTITRTVWDANVRPLRRNVTFTLYVPARP